MFRRIVPFMMLFLACPIAGDVMAQVRPHPKAKTVLGQKGSKNAKAASIRVLARYLQLDKQQMPAIKQLFESRKATLQPLMQQVSQQRKAYKALVSSANPDTAAVDAASVALKDLRAQMAAERKGFVTSFEAQLTPEQKARFEVLQRGARLRAVLAATRKLRIL